MLPFFIKKTSSKRSSKGSLYIIRFHLGGKMEWSVPREVGGGRGRFRDRPNDGYSWGRSIKYLPLVAACENVICNFVYIEYPLNLRISHA